MDITLNVPSSEFWPRCFYDKELRCGEPATREVNAGPSDQELVRRRWHVADMCDCPSCPMRVALRDALSRYQKSV